MALETGTVPNAASSAGALDGVRVLELGGIGPGPFCGMLLADMGAEVVRLERVECPPSSPGEVPPRFDIVNRNKRLIAVNLKSANGVQAVLQLAERADMVIDPFRPGVTERLGLGPEDCHARNPRIVYGRMTGWGQDGPLAQEAGHDINYIALSGALGSIRSRDGAPVIPLNLVGDYGGGALYLAFGLLCALHESKRSGRGQVVDAAMTDGVASLMSLFFGLRAAGAWMGLPGENLIDGGAPYYNVYETADGNYVSVGALEPKFYASLLRCLGIDPETLSPQTDPAGWPATTARFAEIFRTRTRAEWVTVMAGRDACFAPVLGLDEAPDHPHNQARGTFQLLDGVMQPGPAPRLSRTPGTLRTSASSQRCGSRIRSTRQQITVRCLYRGDHVGAGARRSRGAIPILLRGAATARRSQERRTDGREGAAGTRAGSTSVAPSLRGKVRMVRRHSACGGARPCPAHLNLRSMIDGETPTFWSRYAMVRYEMSLPGIESPSLHTLKDGQHRQPWSDGPQTSRKILGTSEEIDVRLNAIPMFDQGDHPAATGHLPQAGPLPRFRFPHLLPGSGSGSGKPIGLRDRRTIEQRDPAHPLSSGTARSGR